MPDAPPTDAQMTCDALSALAVGVGFFEGVLPFVGRWLLDGTPLLALPGRLPAPWWWLVSGAILIAALVALVLLDGARKRAAA